MTPSDNAVGICRALTALGLHSILDAYMHGRGMDKVDKQHHPVVHELQAESAWRQVVWGSVDALRVGSQHNQGVVVAHHVGEHVVLTRVLRALQVGDFAECDRVVQEARNNIVSIAVAEYVGC